jgi:hypothetical protein
MPPKPPAVTIPAFVQWPSEEITRLAGESGKPLEVACAVEFMGADWEAWLGTHFDDDGRARELDVFVEKNTRLSTGSKGHKLGLVCTTRVLVSCKGFPRHCGPLTYSVSKRSIQGLDPSLIASEVALPVEPPQRAGVIVHAEMKGAERLLEELDLHEGPRVVGFDTLEAKVNKGVVGIAA